MNNADRAERARKTLEFYRSLHKNETTFLEEPLGILQDIISDTLHLAQCEDGELGMIDDSYFIAVMDTAFRNYEAEADPSIDPLNKTIQ